MKKSSLLNDFYRHIESGDNAKGQSTRRGLQRQRPQPPTLQFSIITTLTFPLGVSIESGDRE
jgi:hypothetical protein